MLIQRECAAGVIVWDSTRDEADAIWFFNGTDAYYFPDDYVEGETLEYPPGMMCPHEPGRGGIAKVACKWFGLTGCLTDAAESPGFSSAITIETIEGIEYASVTLKDGTARGGKVTDPNMPLPKPPPTLPPIDAPESDGMEDAPEGMVASLLDLTVTLTGTLRELTRMNGLLGQMLSSMVAYGNQPPPAPWGFDGESWFVLLPQNAAATTMAAIQQYVATFRTTSGFSHDDALWAASGKQGHHILAIRPSLELLNALQAFEHPYSVPIIIHILGMADDVLKDSLDAWAAQGIRWEE